jgi:hypothetical protein
VSFMIRMTFTGSLQLLPLVVATFSRYPVTAKDGYYERIG